jgi:hypothetical protein
MSYILTLLIGMAIGCFGTICLLAWFKFLIATGFLKKDVETVLLDDGLIRDLIGEKKV